MKRNLTLGINRITFIINTFDGPLNSSTTSKQAVLFLWFTESKNKNFYIETLTWFCNLLSFYTKFRFHSSELNHVVDAVFSWNRSDPVGKRAINTPVRLCLQRVRMNSFLNVLFWANKRHNSDTDWRSVQIYSEQMCSTAYCSSSCNTTNVFNVKCWTKQTFTQITALP